MRCRRCSMSTWRAQTAGACCCASRISIATRCRPEYEQAIYEDLAWLGIEWEQPVRRQSEHFDDYRGRSTSCEAHGSCLSELREPRRDRRLVDGARRWTLAARSGRRAALSRQPRQHDASRAQGADGGRRALCAAARHGDGHCARRRSDLERSRAGASRRERQIVARIRRPGATSSSPARRCRPAIICRSWSTMRCRA